MSDDKAQAAFHAIQMAIAGFTATDAISGMLGALSLLIGMAAHDEEAAMRVVDSLPGHLRVTVMANWDHARQLREKSALHASEGPARLQ